MLEAKSLSINDKSIFLKYKDKIPSDSYEYLFSSLFLWKNLSNPKFCLYNDMLLIEKYEEFKGNFFMVPYGYDNSNILNLIELLSIKEKQYKNTNFIFGDVDEQFLKTLLSLDNFNFSVTEDINDYEYIYSTKELLDLSGTKFHHKRTNYNKFMKQYKPSLRELNFDSINNDITLLLSSWKNRKSMMTQELLLWDNMIDIAIKNLDVLQLDSMAVYVENELAGFTIGEQKDDTVVIHAEICNPKFNGIYAYINREFLFNYYKNSLYVNRQEDCGDLGLRRAKESYNPIYKLKKYLISIN